MLNELVSNPYITSLAFLEIATELGQLAKVSHVLLHKVPFIGIRYISTF